MSFSFLYEKEDGSDDQEFRQYLHQGLGSVGEGYSNFVSSVKVFYLILLSVIAVSVIVGLCLSFVFLANRFDPNSYWQSFFVTASAGICLFVLNALFIPLLVKGKTAFSILMISLSVIAGYIAFMCSGITQAYLINLAVGFLLLLGLERFFIGWMKRIKEKKDTIKQEQADSEEARDLSNWPPGGGPSAVLREGD